MSNRFQSTHSQGVRQHLKFHYFLLQLFQSTHSQGVRPTILHAAKTVLSFQSTHSQGVRPIFPTRFLKNFLFQSTHSQGVRPNFPINAVPSAKISIHALTRSATFFMGHNKSKYYNFNPRTHKECDCLAPTLLS